MPKFTRFVALILTALLFPLAGASAQGVYDPYGPYNPGPGNPGPGNPGPGGPGSPQQGEVPLTPKEIAQDVHSDVVEELAAINVKNALKSKKDVKLTIAVNGAGTYSVELRRKLSKKLTITLAKGSVKVKTAQPGTRTIKLKTTVEGRRYMRTYSGEKIKLNIRTGFKPEGKKKKTTWWSKSATVDVKAVKSID